MNEWIYKSVAGWYADTISNALVGKQIQEAMGNGEGSTSAISRVIMQVCMDNILPFMCSIGLAIAVLFFLISMLDLATSERLTMDYFIKFFSKLVISIVMITFCKDVVWACINFGNGIMSLVYGNVHALNASINTDRDAIFNSIYENYMTTKPGFGIIFASIDLLVMNLVGIVLKVVVYVIAFTRILEMGVRGAFMPVAMGLMSEDGFKGSGGRYIKKFLAVCSQGAVLSIIGVLSTLAMQGTLDRATANPLEGAGDLILILGIAFATVSLMFKSIGLINDAFGA